MSSRRRAAVHTARSGHSAVMSPASRTAGGFLHLLGAINCPGSLGISDNVQSNDVPYLDHFPYLGLPHQGYNHEHDHGVSVFSAVTAGMGLFGLLLAIAV